MRLLGAHIGGVLSFEGASLENKGSRALSADGIHVDGGMFCCADDKQRFEASGEVRLLGAHIGGTVSFNGARLSNKETPALHADRLHVNQDMHCDAVDGQRFEASGELSLVQAHIVGALSFTGASLCNDKSTALRGDGLQIDGGMFCRADEGQRFEATGELRLVRARIAGEVNLQGASLSNNRRPALNADWLQVDGNMLCSRRQ